ncbi:MAG TPA: ATP-grasp domain-containing protein, partial [Prolixibacteraceae bacterium]|nr:ATP-grasp domain-containing protein [Prolixibacteraceae bacterium]
QAVKYPAIVKPTMEAGSFGAQVVNSNSKLMDAVKEQKEEFHQIVFAENFIKGREFVLGLIGNGDDLECFPLVEIILEEDPESIRSKDGKVDTLNNKIVPSDIPEDTLNRIKVDAKKLFRLLRLRDYARIDIRMDEQGNYFFLKINSMASLGKNDLYTFSGMSSGLNYDELILKLFDIAASKYFNSNQKLKVHYESILEANRG